MKNTVRARFNGATKPVPAQTKISLNPAPENEADADLASPEDYQKFEARIKKLPGVQILQLMRFHEKCAAMCRRLATHRTPDNSQSFFGPIVLPSHYEEINSTIDPELREVCAEWSADKRKSLAKKFHRWASDLERTAALLAWFENHNPNTPWHAAN